jgi:four helix bundle protein
MEGGLQELDETSYWLDLLTESGQYTGQDAFELIQESDELIRIFISIIKKRTG